MALIGCTATKKVEKLYASTGNMETKYFNNSQLEGLPAPVKRYFQYALKDGMQYPSSLRLKHGGFFKLGKDKDWIKIKGEQYFTAEKPGFAWIGKTKLFNAHDTYINSKGNLSVYLFGLLKIVKSEGETINQAELLRWLGESVWMPTNLLPRKGLRWEGIDEKSAKLTFEYGGQEIYYIVDFNEQWQIVQVKTKRYIDKENLEIWVGNLENYKEINGMMVPTEIEAKWLLESGEYSYARFKVHTFEYNIPRKF